MLSTLGLGLALTAAFSGLAFGLWGSQAAFAAAVFGGVALSIQLVSLALLRPVQGAKFDRFIARWGIGMGLRFLGVVAIAVASGFDRAHFPAIPVAVGFLGVLIPLLIYEVRLIR
jgi:hypothetical protein